MMRPITNGNVPDSTPPADQPMPLSRLDTATAAPNAPVSRAVAVSSARRVIISTACFLVADQPALIGGDLVHALDVLGHELVELGAGQEHVGLRRLLDVVLPFRRRLHLLHEVDVKRSLLGCHLPRQPYHARLLELRDGKPRLDAGRDVVPILCRRHLGAVRQALWAEGADRALRAALPLADAFARSVHMAVDMTA